MIVATFQFSQVQHLGVGCGAGSCEVVMGAAVFWMVVEVMLKRCGVCHAIGDIGGRVTDACYPLFCFFSDRLLT